LLLFPATRDNRAGCGDITPPRTAQSEDQALAAVIVIDREDIERLQPASLPEGGIA